MECPYSKLVVKSALEQYLYCNVAKKYCIKQKFCHVQNKQTNTDDWEKCPQYQNNKKKEQ